MTIIESVQIESLNERQAAVVAAAESLRRWVEARRDSWQHEGLAAFAPVHAPALEMTTTAVVAPSLPDTVDIAPTPSQPSARPRSLDLAAVAATTMRGVARMFAAGGRAIGGQWRLIAGAAAAAPIVWGAVTYGPTWAGAARRQLADAGKRASVFDRPADPVAAPAAVVAKGKAAAGKPATRRSGHVQVDSNPAGARVLVDGEDRGQTPLTLADLSLGTHTIVLRSEQGSVERTISAVADKIVQVNEAIYSGWVHVSSPIDVDISENGRNIRLDDSNQVLLSPGPHELRLENRAYRFVEARTLTVKPGDTTNLVVTPPRSSLSVKANTPAEVLVDGALIGGTPLNDFAIDLGVREIVVRNASGERRSTVTVTVEPLSLAIDFSR